MKKKYIILLLIVALLGTWGSCKSDFLTVQPAGSLDQTLLQTTKGLDAVLVGAYSLLDGATNGIGSWESSGTNWVWGSIRGLEANKGTDSGDQPDINPIQTFNETANNSYLDAKWRMAYEAISRCNTVITITNKALAAGKIDQAAADLYINQARLLRGWYHFDAWRLWNKIPYMDEKADPAKVTNSEDAAPKFIEDIKAGLSLPLDMGAIGKWNKTVAEVVLAKALMQVNQDYAGAKTQLLDVVANGKKPNNAAIGLAPTYGEIFAIENRNGPESVYTVQYSVNDGSGAWNGGYGEQLNFPYKSGGSPGGCCGFFDPTQEFVNTFRTAGGLPIANFGYNAQPVKNDFGIAITAAFTPDAGPLDPRLDWSVGRRGIPYWDWGLHTGADWIRDQTYSGPFSPKKEVYKKSQTGTYTEVGYWTSGITSNGYRFIRYADVLLLLAECQIETGDLAGATANINLVRARAANADGWVKMDDGTNAGNYQIAVYPATFASVDDAHYALQIERKLELGQEGHRFFDLQRWNADSKWGSSYGVTELNRALTYEKTMPWGNSLYGSATVEAKDMTLPVPQRQIDISNGNLVQNR
jgi:starch-binding outer membrane protein, SusD/RagB family